MALSHRISSFAYIFTEHNIKRSLNVAKLKAKGVPSEPQWGAIQEKMTLLSRDAVFNDYPVNVCW